MPLKCVVHYHHLEINSRVIPLDEHKLRTLKDGKFAREKLGGDNLHGEQSQRIPSVLDGTKHGAHSECYKKFTLAISAAKKRNVLEETSPNDNFTSKRCRRSGDGSKQLFPAHCMLCKSEKPITVNRKKQYPHTLTLSSSAEAIISAAKIKSDETMMALTIDGNLCEREFKVHDKCHKDYTRILSKIVNKSEEGVDKENHILNASDFEVTMDYIHKEVIIGGKAVSLKFLTELSGKDKNNRHHRARVKQKLQQHFKCLLFINSARNKDSQIIVSDTCIENLSAEDFLTQYKENAIALAAAELRKDVIQLISDSPEIPWPPKPEDLMIPERQPPASVVLFFRKLLQADHHTTGESVEQCISSFSQDIVHAVSRGSFLTFKHLILGNALHTMTGQKAVVQIISKLGNCCTYETVRKVETAQAELSQKLSSQHQPLPLVPIDDSKHVLTHFWWDNFDCKKENQRGSIHTTHGVAFQEHSKDTKLLNRDDLTVEPSGKRTITVQHRDLFTPVLNPHKPPVLFRSSDMKSASLTKLKLSEDILLLWVFKRIVFSGNQQLIPRFVGWITQMLSKRVAPTLLTFLPPILNPITEYSTVCETIYRSVKLSESVNMKYTHITVDIGAAEKYYKVIWNKYNEFKKVIIHLGDFHAFQHCFGNIGKFVTDSGFDDIIYQAGLCTDGGLNKVINGKSYNKCWLVHEVLSEAIDRLLHEMLFSVDNIDERLKKVIRENKVSDTASLIESEIFVEYREKYHALKGKCMTGEFGSTAKYWTIYHYMINLLHKLHYAININDYELRRVVWEHLLQLSFVMNKQNYARYGTFYVMQLGNLDKTHPGAREEIEKRGVSVCRNKMNIRQSIDGAGEQTFMKNSKTAGGIKKFVQQESTYEKWVLSRPGQSEYIEALKQQTGLCGSMDNPRKCLQPSQIRKHEEAVQKIVDVLKYDFINPFSPDLDKSQLFNIASGKPVNCDTRDCLLSVFERGLLLMNEFKDRINGESEKHLFNAISRVKWCGFETKSKKINIKVDGKIKEVGVQKDIFALLAVKSDKDLSSVDIKHALTFPLAPVSLPLATPDGTMRKTNKAKLYDALESMQVNTSVVNSTGRNHYIIDLAATLRTITKVPKTFRDLALKLLNDIPEKYSSVYVACDTYKDQSIKLNERNVRGTSDRLLLRSPSVRIPSDFQFFLNNGDNKERCFELIENVFIENSSKLEDREIFFARKDVCKKITNVRITEEFLLNHEEADTKVTFFATYATTNRQSENDVVIVRSSSGDIDIPVIMLAENVNGNVFIDNGTSNKRKLLSLNQSGFSDLQKKALLGIHSFTGTDQNSSMLRKGKMRCWKVAQGYLETFAELGTDFSISDDLVGKLEKFVMELYGCQSTENIDEARNTIFWETFRKKKKIIDLSMLPPCRKSLMLHIKRSNYIAKVWRQASNAEMIMPCPTEHGWNANYTLKWHDQPYPEDIRNLLGQVSEEEETPDEDEDEDEFEDHEADVFG